MAMSFIVEPRRLNDAVFAAFSPATSSLAAAAKLIRLVEVAPVPLVGAATAMPEACTFLYAS